jgi:hypothetical protein
MRPHLRIVFMIALVCAASAFAPTSSYAQPPRKKPGGAATPAPAPAATPDPVAGAPRKPGKTKTFDFTGIDISGQNRSPQLLYFLERANEELERASLEKRSFIPEMVRSIEEDKL